MIKSIKSLLNPNVRIDMEHAVQSEIYALDSVNLIIGDNGSGKTRLIRSIIGDLTKLGAESHFMFDGNTSGLGVIYYTAAPFHVRFLPSRTETVGFLDASQNNGQKHNFLKAATEFVQVRELLGLNTPNEVKRGEDYAWLTQRLLSDLNSLANSNQWGGPLFQVLKGEHAELSARVNKLTRERNRFAHELDDSYTQSQKSIHGLDPKDDLLREKLAALNEELEQSKLAVLRLKDSINTEFLKKCRPKSRKHALEWLTLSAYLAHAKLRTGSRKYDLVHRFFTRDYGFDDETSNEWKRIWTIVDSFTKAVEKAGIGEFRWSNQRFEFEVSLPGLVESEIPEALIEEAQAIGLLRLGFETLSSGEAAITHQLASISTCIHQLAALGRERILVFIDEGDLLLHLRWQRKYLSLVDLRLSRIRNALGLKSVQVVVATHSPLLTSDVIKGAILKLGTNGAPSGFGAPLQRIVNYSFGTPAIGEIAEKTIDCLNAKSQLTATELAVVEEIDDPFIRDLLRSKK